MRTAVRSTACCAAALALAAPALAGGAEITPPKFSGLLQAWYLAGSEGAQDTFRVRRTELKAVGEVGSKVRWTVMIDPAKVLSVNTATSSLDGERVVSDVSVNQAGRILQDAFISLGPVSKLQLDIGQLKVPMGAEGLQSSAALETIERALFASDRARGGAFGDVRDVGAVVRYTPAASLDVVAGTFNGSGESQNDLDKNERKAVAGRLALRPAFAKGLQLGAWGVWAGEEPGRPRRDRMGGELQLVRERFVLRAEYVTGEDGAIERQGYYGLFAYELRPEIEAVVRFDSWDPDTLRDAEAATVRERDYLAGVNYSLHGTKAKLQLNVLQKTFAEPVLPDRHLILLNLQTSW